MVYIVAASSIHHPIDAFSPEQQSKGEERVYATPILCLNPYQKIRQKIEQNLNSQDLKDKTENVASQDVLNENICRHRNNNYRPSVPHLINVLKTFLDKPSVEHYERFNFRQKAEQSQSFEPVEGITSKP